MISGLSCLMNLCGRKHLASKLKIQIEEPIMAFIDPANNTIKVVIDAFAIIELVNPNHMLSSYYYPEDFFDGLRNVLKKVVLRKNPRHSFCCLDEVDGFDDVDGGDVGAAGHRYTKRDMTGDERHRSAIKNVLSVIRSLSKQKHYRSKCLCIMQENDKTVDSIARSGLKEDVEKTANILKDEVPHRCPRCNTTVEFIKKHSTDFDSGVGSLLPRRGREKEAASAAVPAPETVRLTEAQLSAQCPYFQRCLKFLDHKMIDSTYFEILSYIRIQFCLFDP